MDLPTALRRYQGVARASMLYDLGVRQTDIARALDAGTVLRPRRGWIAHIKADAELIAAARNGVVLTCITQARRLGLWVREEPSTHVAARTPVSRAEAAGCTIHWGKPILPRPPDSLEDPLENVLSFVADCQPFEAALAIWESALNKQLVVPGQLQALPLRKRARLLLADSTPFSDSGLETLFSHDFGGFRYELCRRPGLTGIRSTFSLENTWSCRLMAATTSAPNERVTIGTTLGSR